MNTQITAIFEGGMLKPTVPLALPEGASVEVIVLDPARQYSGSAAQIIAAIAAMPLDEGEEFGGRDHDKILYGNRETPVNSRPSIGIRDEDWPTDPDGIAKLVVLIESRDNAAADEPIFLLRGE